MQQQTAAIYILAINAPIALTSVAAPTVVSYRWSVTTNYAGFVFPERCVAKQAASVDALTRREVLTY